MVSTLNNKPVDSLLWIEVTPPENPKFWARSTRMLADSSPQDRENAYQLLKSGGKIAYEISGITMQCAPMPDRDRKRLEHLQTFEEGGFRLATFRHNIALFYKNDEDYYSMNEMAERGFLPSPAIAVGQWNVSVTSFQGQLIDVFVPVALGPIYFVDPPVGGH